MDSKIPTKRVAVVVILVVVVVGFDSIFSYPEAYVARAYLLCSYL
jgi:regulator of protease activity HflC (stomatin/prohibitin superfamily)